MSDLKQKLLLAAKSASAIAKNALTGQDIKVSDDEFKRRMSICRGCPKFNPKLEQCLECGCFLQVKAKLNSMECPLHKWELTTISDDTSNNSGNP